MPSPTLTNLIAEARRVSQDNDANTANYAFTDAEVTARINRYYIRHKLAVDIRPQLLSATTTGLTFVDLTAAYTTSAVNLRRILNLWIVGSAGAVVVDTANRPQPLEKCTENEILEWNTDYVYAAFPPSNYPARYSAERIGTGTAASVGKWRVRLHPIPNFTGYLLTEAEVEPTALSSGSDIPDLQDEEGYALGSLTGAWMAARIGRTWLVGPALAEIPESMRHLVASVSKQTEPEQPSQLFQP